MNVPKVVFAVGFLLLAVGGSCLDSGGVWTLVAAGVAFAGLVLLSLGWITDSRKEARAAERRRAEHERQDKRDHLFRNWCGCSIRPHMGDYHTTD